MRTRSSGVTSHWKVSRFEIGTLDAIGTLLKKIRRKKSDFLWCVLCVVGVGI